MLNLRDDFARAWAGKDPFAIVQGLQGKVYRHVKARRTLQFEQDGKSYFVKIHLGIGWWEIIKDLLQLRMPVLGAQNEWTAIHRLQEIGIDTMNVAAYGQRGINPATQQSFIVTEDLHNTISLEDYCAGWPINPPPVRFKRAVIRKLATISRTLHSNGVCHRDYYLCHFLLHRNAVGDVDTRMVPKMSLIDLHRALVAHRLAQRWIVKDIAGLYFSAMHIGLQPRDFLRFVKLYSGKPLRHALTIDASFWYAVAKRAQQLDRKLNPARHANDRRGGQ